MKSDSKLLEKELSDNIYGIFLNIGQEFGCHFKEEVYLKACEVELIASNIQFVIKPEIKIISLTNKKKVGVFIPDIIVEDKIIVEIKVQKCLMESSLDQLIKYLEKSKYEIGYLVNFGTSYTQIIRRIYTNNRKKLPF